MRVAILLLILVPAVLVLPAPTTTTPEASSTADTDTDTGPTATISLPPATVVGNSIFNVDFFDGIPYAQQPTGSLRLRPPLPLHPESSLGTIFANRKAKSCPQMLRRGIPGFVSSVHQEELPQDELPGPLELPIPQLDDDDDTNNSTTQLIVAEDCLTLNIRRPAGTASTANLPVIVWFHGGAFSGGSPYFPDSKKFVKDSIFLKLPVVFVSMNYRTGGFGFLPGSEIRAAGAANLGLLDQRLALQWVADNVASFGGDPRKVTIWGVSAGAISVLDQMVLYDGDHLYKGRPLFRGAVMNSGGVIPADPVDCARAQEVYDTVVRAAGCDGDGATNSSTLECLRGLEFAQFLTATRAVPAPASYRSVALSYLPRPDGRVLTQSPDRLVEAGKFAAVPFIIGDQEDEGTIFAIWQRNISTTEQLVDYLATVFFQNATRQQLEQLVATYPGVSDGSPFRTWVFNNWYPQYKRIAAILGDLVFTLTRRAFLAMATRVKPEVRCWSYLASYYHAVPIFGTYHSSDQFQIFFGIKLNHASPAMHTYLLSFVYELDPNARTQGWYIPWPRWSEDRQLMHFRYFQGGLLKDDFRAETYEFLVKNSDAFHI